MTKVFLGFSIPFAWSLQILEIGRPQSSITCLKCQAVWTDGLPCEKIMLFLGVSEGCPRASKQIQICALHRLLQPSGLQSEGGFLEALTSKEQEKPESMRSQDRLEEYLEKVDKEPDIMESEAENKRSVASMRALAAWAKNVAWRRHISHL